MYATQDAQPIGVHGRRGSAHGPLPSLFARYLTGEITDSSWRRIMSVLDEAAATEHERVALASFLNDAWVDLGPEEIEVPALRDVEDLVSMTRQT